MNKRFEKKQLKINTAIDLFLENKKDIHNDIRLFINVFEHLKAVTDNDKDVYILDSLTENQKIMFYEHYRGYVSGGGTFYSGKYCNDNNYRNNFYIFNSIVLL